MYKRPKSWKRNDQIREAERYRSSSQELDDIYEQVKREQFGNGLVEFEKGSDGRWTQLESQPPPKSYKSTWYEPPKDKFPEDFIKFNEEIGLFKSSQEIQLETERETTYRVEPQGRTLEELFAEDEETE